MKLQEPLNKKTRIALASIGFTILSACSTFEIKPSDHPDAVFLPRPIETLGETIAREQQGPEGCLVAGSNKNTEPCRQLLKQLSPPSPKDDSAN